MDIDKIFQAYGITPTPIRILVYKCLCKATSPLSLTDIEEELESVDKSTISRTLSLLKDRHLLHSFTDGSGSVKYELCTSTDHSDIDDFHVHFRCERCGVTQCLSSITIPEVQLPEGFEIHEKSYILTGICPQCYNRLES